MAEGETLRQRRLREEWNLAGQLAARNPGVFTLLSRRSQADAELFDVELGQTSGITGWDGAQPRLARSHRVTFRFPRFFPSMPIEAHLAVSVFHPNVDPETGFVCLWTRTSPGDTVMEAARRLQQIVAWKLVNFDATHVMQPEAAAPRGPLEFTPIVEVEDFRLQKDFAARPESRRRLLPLEETEG